MLRRLQAGQNCTVEGLYEYVSGTHTRTHHFQAKPILIIEGLCVMNFPLDFKIFLDVHPSTAAARAKSRNLTERGMKEERWGLFQRLFHGACHSVIPALKQKADVVIDTTDNFPFPRDEAGSSYATLQDPLGKLS